MNTYSLHLLPFLSEVEEAGGGAAAIFSLAGPASLLSCISEASRATLSDVSNIHQSLPSGGLDSSFLRGCGRVSFLGS
jgi:hypothetical protein